MFSLMLEIIVGACCLVWLVCFAAALIGALRTEVESRTVGLISQDLILPPAPRVPREYLPSKRARVQNEQLRKLIS